MHCDLHIHSTASDGSLTPTQIVELAKESGLKAIALTDHNNIGGLDEFVAAAEKYDIEYCCGCEFTTEWEGMDIHLLGMFLKKEYYSQIREYLSFQQKAKEKSNIACVERLHKAGYDITYQEVTDAYPNTYINRVHIANILKNKGVVETIGEAFEWLLDKKTGYYKEGGRLNALETVRYIKDWGSVSVIAHPTLDLTYEQSETLIRGVKPDGIEVLHSAYTKSDIAFANKMAEKYSLLKSGGTDFHGVNKPHIRLGSLNVPYEFYEKMKTGRN